MNKRSFLKNASLLSLSAFASLGALGKFLDASSHLAPETTASDDDFWQQIRGGYKLKPDYINLENGYYCIMPQEILTRYLKHIMDVNLEGAHYMRTVQFDNKYASAARIAELAGVDRDELILTRNTTESLDLVISGLDWKSGDEAVMAEQDYGAMLDMFKQISRRYGSVNKTVSIPMDPKSDDEIVDLYAAAITPRTRLLMVCHMINITGHILPVRKICDMAHSKGVPVMVDGAHAFAHLQFRIPDLHCDFYGTSLHKWLSVPIGAGALFVNRESVKKLWPIFAESGKADDDILKLNHTGTHPPATDLIIVDAVNFYQKVGAARKEARLRYLQNYWVDKVRTVDHLQVYTPTDPARSCAIANVGVKGMKPADMATTLLEKYKIYTVAIDNAGVKGCRITPNIFTTTAELDALVHALKDMG